MRALESAEKVSTGRRMASVAKLSTIALVAAACGVDARGFQEDSDVPTYGVGGTASAMPGPVAAAGAAPVPSSVNAAAGAPGVAVSPGSGGGNAAGTGGVGTSGASEGNPAPAATLPPAAAGAGGSAGGPAGGGVGTAMGGSANAGAAGGQAGGEMAVDTAGVAAPAEPLPEGPCALRLVVNTPTTFDTLLGIVAQDVIAFAVADRPFLRYITFTNRQNAGAPQCELDGDTRLLLELLDRFVVDPSQRQVAPVAAGANLIYRIDLRALGWDVGVALRGLQFISTWEAMVNFSPYATEFAGANANNAISATLTTVPFLFASALIEQVLNDVPPLPAGALAELQQDPELAAALNRISAPVESADVVGDLGIIPSVFTPVFSGLDPAFQSLSGGGVLEREVYAPLFLPALCTLTDGEPAELVTCSR